jgi:hypothetical protein
VATLSPQVVLRYVLMLSARRGGGNSAALLDLELLDSHLSGPEISVSTPLSGTGPNSVTWYPPIWLVERWGLAQGVLHALLGRASGGDRGVHADANRGEFV